MFALALLVGIYSYIIFMLGIAGILTRQSILISSTVFIICSIYYFYTHKEDFPVINLKNKKVRPYFILFLILAGVNLAGALAPEISFDALWYHLTLPKIFLLRQEIFPVTEGIFYYSVMPKLGEMLFTPFVAFNLEVFAKLMQWAFGILTSVVVYKISRRYLDAQKSFFSVFIFYSSLVVAWESTVAYVDLIRAFFEAMGLWGFLVWRETKDRKILIESAIFIGLAISTKLMAIGSIPIFICLFLLFDKNKVLAIKNAALFALIAILSAFPWFLMSYLATGNPIFPIFSHNFSTGDPASLLNPFNLSKDLYTLFIKEADPISPLYIIFLPLVFVYFKKLNLEQKMLVAYAVLALLAWYLTPRMGGGRFILAYLPVISVLCAVLISKINNKALEKYSYAVIIFVFVTTIFYRGIANVRYLPIILGFEKKDEFLTKNLNFNFGDFYDTDGFFKKTIGNDTVLLYGFHNLYYADFPFIHESFARRGDKFKFIATQDSELPERFSNWNLIYTNDKTKVNVYSLGGGAWHY